jgi:hypothetical protein
MLYNDKKRMQIKAGTTGMVWEVSHYSTEFHFSFFASVFAWKMSEQASVFDVKAWGDWNPAMQDKDLQ